MEANTVVARHIDRLHALLLYKAGDLTAEETVKAGRWDSVQRMEEWGRLQLQVARQKFTATPVRN